MSAQMIHTNIQEEISPLRLVKSELKVFTTRYLESLNLITAVGWSVTDDAWIKYCQILADMETHLLRKDDLTIYFKFELFNSSSASYLFKIIQRFNDAHAAGKTVKIYWSCALDDDNEMLDAGLDFAAMCDFQFKISNL
ncbi:SiaC family regulatory phosphoprotein [Ekhidna sp.]|uniref:SiaC family regulatory phosphoprotein n=1 Tax=Ekhidna sp. TaxID=2608089 RepID=UPI003297D531